jgi:hypothetical protein
MKNILTNSAVQQQECEDHPLVRAAYAVGVGIMMVGSVMPHSERWMTCGIALIAFSILY